MAMAQPCWVIRSIREDGERFRPSDWIERISSSVAEFGPDRRLRYLPLLHPQVIEGEKVLVVAGGLAERHPALYEHIIRFAHSNRLQLDKGRCPQRVAA